MSARPWGMHPHELPRPEPGYQPPPEATAEPTPIGLPPPGPAFPFPPVEQNLAVAPPSPPSPIVEERPPVGLQQMEISPSGNDIRPSVVPHQEGFGWGVLAMTFVVGAVFGIYWARTHP